MRLVDILSDIVNDEMTTAINSQVDSTVRRGFRGAPYFLLDKLLGRYQNTDGLLIEGDNLVPVLLVSDEVNYGPSNTQSGKCTDNYLVAIRGGQNILALLPAGTHLCQSMDSSIEEFGLDLKTLIGEQSLKDDPFVVNLIDHLKPSNINLTNWTRIKKVILKAILSWESVGKQEGNFDMPWELLEKLFEIPGNSADWEEIVTAFCGYPKASKENIGKPIHIGPDNDSERQGILSNLTSYLETRGLLGGKLALIEDADNSLHPHLKEFFKHLEKRCESVPDFASAPTTIYSLIDEKQKDIPDWWKVLDLNVWGQLLQESTPQKKYFKVSCVNSCYPNIKGMPIVVNELPKFEIDQVNGQEIPTGIEIFFGRGKNAHKVGHSTVPGQWCPSDVRSHSTYLSYKFDGGSNFKPEIIKILSLSKFEPGVVVGSPGAEKVTQPRRNRKKQIGDIIIWDVDIFLKNMGNHQIEIYYEPNITTSDKAVSIEDNGKQKNDAAVITGLGKNCLGFLADIDEEGAYSVDIFNSPSGDYSLRIFLHASEQEPVGVESEYEKLVLENTLNQYKSVQVEPIWSKRIYGLEQWILDDENSFYPLIISNDYLDNWFKPDWTDTPILSRLPCENDMRPMIADMKVPEQYVKARNLVLKEIKNRLNNRYGIIEQFRFREAIHDEEFVSLLINYLSEYHNWLKFDFSSAIISDLHFVIPPETGCMSLAIEPEAVILSPTHPIKLAWHCIAHEYLDDALQARKKCPAASILNPFSIPDYLEIPCIRPGGGTEIIPFISIKSSSPYWTVLWNGNMLPELNSIDKYKFWDENFGITIGGTSNGFNTSQVQRAITDVRNIMIAKNSLAVSIESDTAGDSSCNRGIINWCEQHLGESEHDPWTEAGPRKLRIYDHRNSSSLRPSPAIIANLTNRTNGTVNWFSTQDHVESDLCIIVHLGQRNPILQSTKIASPISEGGLIRAKIRTQIGIDGGKKSIIEARKGVYYKKNCDDTSLSDLLPLAIELMEAGNIKELSVDKSGFVFTPAINTLVKQFENTTYCALSSSNIDPSCFFGKHGQAYLWDYDLPHYSTISGENNGFYLLVKDNPTIMEAVSKAIQEFGPTNDSALSNDDITKILYEISLRGLPTLKRLSSGGTGAIGEVGVLVALRILQDTFIEGEHNGCLVPPYSKHDQGEGTHVALIIPVDPFQFQLDALRSALDTSKVDSLQRPDLIICTIKIDEIGEPKAIKISPIEIKTRTSNLSISERKTALQQAQSFTKFAQTINLLLKNKKPGHKLWGIAIKEFLTSLLSFSFRVYGQLPEFKKNKEWAKLHERTVGQIFSERIKIQVDEIGRLIVISNSNYSRPHDDDGDGFLETIEIKAADAYQVLLNNSKPLITQIRNKIETWDLYPEYNNSESITSENSFSTPTERLEKDLNLAGTKKINVNINRPKDIEPVEAIDTNHIDKNVRADSNGVRFHIGTTIGNFSNEDLHFWPSNTNLNQLNIGVVGDLGTGKTQLIKTLIYQLISSEKQNRGHRPNFLIFDYKNDYSSDNFVKKTDAKIIEPFNLPINIFDTSNCINERNPWVARNMFFTDVLDKIYAGIGPVQKLNIRNAVKKSYESVKSIDLKEPLIHDVYQHYIAETKGKADSPTNILTDLLDQEIFETNHKSIIPFSKFMEGVVVIKLHSLGQDDNTKNLLVAIFLNFFYEYMLKIKKQPYLGNNPQLRFIEGMMLVDEADNIMKYDFDVLRKILLQGREFGVGVLLASQYLSHFKTQGTNYVDPLLTWFIHKVPNITVREIESIGLTHVDNELVEQIKSLYTHECLFKSIDREGSIIAGLPFYKIT